MTVTKTGYIIALMVCSIGAYAQDVKQLFPLSLKVKVSNTSTEERKEVFIAHRGCGYTKTSS